jgi:hypothetical protein
MNADKTGRIARRVNDVAQTVGKRDPRARAFAVARAPAQTAQRCRRVNKQTEIPDWETLLAHAALLQSKIPAAIRVGARLLPYTPAIAFPSTMITSSQTWQRITTRPFSLWNPSLDGKGELTNQTDREIRR